jgi:hypothetical protein
MENTIAPAPAVSFTEATLKSFDKKMEQLGFIYEGAFGAVWIYRKSNTQSIDIQVGLGGVLYVSMIESRCAGSVIKRTKLDLSKVNTPVKLFNLIKKSI